MISLFPRVKQILSKYESCSLEGQNAACGSAQRPEVASHPRSSIGDDSESKVKACGETTSTNKYEKNTVNNPIPTQYFRRLPFAYVVLHAFDQRSVLLLRRRGCE